MKYAQLRERFMRWWLPFWYGWPCPHGNYGPRYNSGSFLLSCRDCRRGFKKEWHETHCGKCGCEVVPVTREKEKK